MHRDQYFFGSAFLGFTAGASLLQSLLRFQNDTQLFAHESFSGWFLVTSVVYVIGELFLLTYFHHKSYRFALIAKSLMLLVSITLFLVTYRILVARELQAYYLPALFAQEITAAVFAISLIVSPAGKSPWLKSAGILILAISGLIGVSLVWGLSNPGVQSGRTLEAISRWTSLVGSFVPLLFIKQFLNERQRLKSGTRGHARLPLSKSFLGLAGVMALLATLGYGLSLTREVYQSSYYEERNYQIARELASLFEARSFVGSRGDTRQYRWLPPVDYDPSKEYPLVVSLHHGGLHGDDNVRQLSSEPGATLSSSVHRRKYPAFLFMPQCPEGVAWGGIPGVPAIDELVYEAVIALGEEFAIDERRRYVAGTSGGGYGSWHFIGDRPELFAAAVPIGGEGDPALASDMMNVSVWAFHGEDDHRVPVSSSRQMIDAIEQAGGEPRYTEFPGAGHYIWDRVIKTPGLMDWLFAQHRE